LRHVAAEHRLAATRIATTGSSAGGGIALYIALHDDLAAPDSADRAARHSSRVSCVYAKNAQVSYDPRFWQAIGLSAATNAWSVDRLYGAPLQRHDALHLEAVYATSSPITFLTADDPPIRLDYTYSAELTPDTPKSALIHHPFHGVEMNRRCDAQGVVCELHYPDGQHEEESGYEFLIRHLSNTTSGDAE
jgi:acetyl esterase/lipase